MNNDIKIVCAVLALILAIVVCSINTINIISLKQEMNLVLDEIQMLENDREPKH